MIDKMQIVAEVTGNAEYKRVCQNIAKGTGLADDLYQELILILLEYNPEKLVEKYEAGFFKPFVVTILLNMFRNAEGRFYKNFRKTSLSIDFNPEVSEIQSHDADIEAQAQLVERILLGMDWYDKNIFRLYIEKGSYAAVSKATGIRTNTVWYSVKRTKNYIKSKLDENGL